MIIKQKTTKRIFLFFYIALLFSFKVSAKTYINDITILENNFLKIKINKKGAELVSIYNKKTSFEHIWQADKNTWNQSAPILFPIVGKLKNHKYIIDNKEYTMKNHGFASYLDFEIVSKNNNVAVFKLSNNEDTLKEYPYKFSLTITYTLKDDRLLIRKEVNNTDNKLIYFSIGAHPGFNIPFNKEEKYSDYFVEFDKKETVNRLPLTKKLGLLSTNTIKNYLNNTNQLALNHKMFKDRAIILEGLQSSTIKIKSKNSKTEVVVGIKNIPLLGLWTTAKANMPFVCIEPWYGISDSEDSNGDFKQKKAIQKLDKGETFTMKYFIEIKNTEEK